MKELLPPPGSWLGGVPGWTPDVGGGGGGGAPRPWSSPNPNLLPDIPSPPCPPPPLRWRAASAASPHHHPMGGGGKGQMGGACTRVCKRARVQGIVGGIKGYGERLGGGCRAGLRNPPPCDPTQVLFPLSCMGLHTRVQTCEGTRDCGWGKGIWGEVGGGCRVGLWDPPPCDPIQVVFPVLLLSLHTRVQTCKGARDCGGG